MTGETIFKGWAIGVASISTCNAPYLLSISIQITYQSWEEAQRIDEVIPVERIGVSPMDWARISSVGSCV